MPTFDQRKEQEFEMTLKHISENVAQPYEKEDYEDFVKCNIKNAEMFGLIMKYCNKANISRMIDCLNNLTLAIIKKPYEMVQPHDVIDNVLRRACEIEQQIMVQTSEYNLCHKYTIKFKLAVIIAKWEIDNDLDELYTIIQNLNIAPYNEFCDVVNAFVEIFDKTRDVDSYPNRIRLFLNEYVMIPILISAYERLELSYYRRDECAFRIGKDTMNWSTMITLIASILKNLSINKCDEMDENDYYFFNIDVLKIIYDNLDVVVALEDLSYEYFQIVTRISYSNWKTLYDEYVSDTNVTTENQIGFEFKKLFENLTTQFQIAAFDYMNKPRGYERGFEILNNILATSVYVDVQENVPHLKQLFYDNFNDYIRKANDTTMYYMLGVINHILGLPPNNVDAFYLVFEKIMLNESCENLREGNDADIATFCSKQYDKVIRYVVDIIHCLENDTANRDVHAIRLVGNKTRDEKMNMVSNLCSVFKFILEDKKPEDVTKDFEDAVYYFYLMMSGIFSQLLSTRKLAVNCNLAKEHSIDKRVMLSYLAIYNIEPCKGDTTNFVEPIQTRFYIKDVNAHDSVVLQLCFTLKVIVEYWQNDYDITIACLNIIKGLCCNEVNMGVIRDNGVLEMAFHWANQMKCRNIKDALEARKIFYNSLSILMCPNGCNGIFACSTNSLTTPITHF
ncbi:hypothetical protein EIN_150050 [Entamoeba invadens IP1]|uniref:Uncharacterized protein n=1 Tax=Entamoeba invadens IP1 TaxID=370355 RepID=A0A0A1UBT8_ENTIV|nr:hypothetical protein EIN_150050 [Entamoeba invadens IP1]ELP91178.1 hypothetical protein EIN_150050 [Entamoeba invadens IP1]|eukprot:XP_004257949.1 hypothetical protein EIN_150050 [Entamoeba invadens IP1]